MAKWWLRLREWMAPDGSAREGRTPGRTVGKSSSKISGKSSGKSSGKGEVSGPDRSLTWAFGLGLALLILHLALFLPVPRLSMDFPEAGQIAETEIRAPFFFDAPLMDRDVQMQRLERVVVEPPVLRRGEPGSGQLRDARMELLLDALADVIADTSAGLEEKVGLLVLQYPTARPDEVSRLLATEEPDSLVNRLERAWSRVMRDGVADMLPVGKYDRIIILTPQAETLHGLGKITVPANLEKRLSTEHGRTRPGSRCRRPRNSCETSASSTRGCGSPNSRPFTWSSCGACCWIWVGARTDPGACRASSSGDSW